MLFRLTWLGILLFAGFANGQRKEASACTAVGTCDNMTMSCPNSRRIFILRMLYRNNTSNSECSLSPPCSPCCQPGPSGCNYSEFQFSTVYKDHGCWNFTSCSFQASQGYPFCPGKAAQPTHAVADYSCLGSEDITAFHRNTTITAPAVAVHYDSADITSYPVGKGGNNTWHCQVETADCFQGQADVMLVREGNQSSPLGCTNVGWSEGSFLPCRNKFQYTSFSTSTPFHVSVRVEAELRLPSGWAVVRAQGNSSLTVTCGFKSEPPSTAFPCRVTSSSHPPSPNSSTPNQGRSSSLTTPGSTTPTPPTMLMSSTSSVSTSLSIQGGGSQPDSPSPGVVEGQSHKMASGCYEVPGCPSLSLTCSADERLFPVRAQYGRLSSNCTCSTTAACADCHLPADSRCFSDFSSTGFFYMYRKYDQKRKGYFEHKCWNVTSCQVDAEQGDLACGTWNFAVVHYSCLRGEDVTSFADNTTISAPAVAVHFNSSDVTSYTFVGGDTQTWHCQVDTANCVQRQADVILVREDHVRGHKSGSSNMGWSRGGFLPRSSAIEYKSLNTTTPFHVSVKVGDDRYPDGWAVVRSQDGSNLTVTCGYTDSNRATGSTCPAEMTLSTTQAPAKDSKTGAMVGGVVAAVLVLVAVAVGVFCFLRRRRLSSGDDIKPGADNSAAHENDVIRMDGDYMAVDAPNRDYATVDAVSGLQNGHAAASGTHGNGRRPSQDPDYDMLGVNMTQSSKPAALYGRLGEVGAEGEDTEYSYDHLARGHESAPDVINSVYNTAALPVTSEGDYNVVNFHKEKQRVITGSAYDVAEVVMSDDTENQTASSEQSVHVRVGASSDVA